MNTKVYVAAINDPKNGNTTMKRLELRQEIEKPINTTSGKLGFLLAGATGPKGTVSANVEKRVCWENVSNDNMAKFGLKIGSILEDTFKVPCRIKVTETSAPQYDGHAAKINPSTGEVLNGADGKSIYRSSTLSFNTKEADNDILIAHVTVSPLAAKAPSTVFSSVEKIAD